MSPLRRRKALRAKVETMKAWQERSRKSGKLKRTSELKRKARLNPVNRKRRAKLHEKQFGAKSRWLRANHPHCAVTGQRGSDFLPVEHAHVLGTRGAGADATGIVPLWKPLHIDFDGSLNEERFKIKWGVSRDDIRDMAREIEEWWRT